MGLITFNGDIMLRWGGFAYTKACCCSGVSCYCLSRTANLQVVERTVVCYRNPYYDATLGQLVYPDGMPCDAASVCPPGSIGRFVTMEGATVKVCGCGGAVSGSGYNYSLITQPNQCNPIAPPP